MAIARDQLGQLKQVVKSASLLLAMFVLAACSSGSSGGSSDEVQASTNSDSRSVTDDQSSSEEDTYRIGGSIGDGPIVGADIEVQDANGDVIASATSDEQADYAIYIPENTPLPIKVRVTGGIDLVTNRAADFELLAIVHSTGIQTVNVSPLTTLAVKTAECRGAPTVDGMNDAWDDILRELNIGLDAVQFGDPMTQRIDRNNVETAVLANESLGELVRRTGAAFGGALPLDLIVDVLACDIADGVFDGLVVGSTGQDERRIFAVAKSSEIAIRLEVIAGALEVDGVNATDAMNNSIRTIMPEATGIDVNTVPVNQISIDGAIQAIDALAGVLPDAELDTLRAILVNANLANVRERVGVELDSSTQISLQGIPDRVAVLDETEISQIGSGHNGSNEGFGNTAAGTDTVTDDTTTGTETGTGDTATGADTGTGDTATGTDTGSGDTTTGTDTGTGDTATGEPPTVQLSVSDTSPAVGTSVTISWSSTAATSCQASGGWSGNQSLSGQQATDSITGAVTYTLSCANAVGSTLEMVSVVPVASLSLSWQAPTENVDGTPLSDLASYQIHYGTNSGEYDSMTEVSGDALSHTLSVPVGTYYIAMTVTDNQGNESGLSNEVTLVAQ